MRERLPAGLRRLWDFVDETLADAGEHQLVLYAQAMAYALVVSLAPLAVALNSIGLQFVESTSVLPGSVLERSQNLRLGDIAGISATWAGPIGLAVAFVLVVLGASRAFRLVNEAVLRVWHQKPVPGGGWAFARTHLVPVGLLLLAGVALFLSSVLGNALASLLNSAQGVAGALGIELEWLASASVTRLLFDFVFSVVLFGVTFAVVPQPRPRVRDVLPGVAGTAAAYSVGQWALSVYLAGSARLAALGAFSAFLGFLIWAYYTSVIVLWGAELTYQIARRRACSRGGADAERYTCLHQ